MVLEIFIVSRVVGLLVPLYSVLKFVSRTLAAFSWFPLFLVKSRLQAVLATPLLKQFFCVLVDEVGSERPANGTV